MKAAPTGFDWLARWYRALEFAAFGRDLERARFLHLGRLAGCRDVLLLGEGDGRCAERLARVAPGARIHCVDSSRGMIERASKRLAGAGAGGRVTFECADILELSPRHGSYDAVATLFVLDCLDEAEVASVVARLGVALRPGARWLFADFVLPPRGAARLRARAWLGLLYGFFRVAAGLRVSALPPSEEILERAGWDRAESSEYQSGMVRSSVYERAPSSRP
jgi:ubiquinone/menaquinone biosynthesis C-methylase UbiE